MKKNKLKSYLSSLLLCLAILFAINGCTDNEEIQTPFSEIQNIQHTFSLEAFNDDVVKENLTVHWDEFNIQQDQENNRTIYEFNTTLKGNNTLQNGEHTLVFTYKLLAFQDGEGNPTFELLKFLADNDKVLNDISSFTPIGFSGTLYHYNLKGENILIKAYKDGVVINEFSDREKGHITAQSKAPEVGGCEEGCYVLVFTDHYTDYYLSINDGAFSYAYSVFKGASSEWVWIGGGGGYGSSGGGNYHHHFDDPHGPAVGADNHAEEHIIIDPQFSQNYPCQSDIVQQAYGLCSPLTQLILDIFEVNDGTNLVYTHSSTIDNNGATTPISRLNTSCSNHTCDITVKLKETYLQTATDLSIARTVIHESLHATLVYMLEEGLLTLPDGTAEPGFADLANAYINFILGIESPENYGKSHHELMVSFVSNIATSLATFGVQNGYDLPFSYYEALSWHGLHTTPDFDILYPEYIDGELNPERITIINTLASEQNNQNYPDGNGGTISPQGNPCN